MFQTLYYNKLYNPYWGYVKINKAVVSIPSPAEKQLVFPELLQAAKASHFQLGWLETFLNKSAEQFKHASFGNYFSMDIAAEQFVQKSHADILNSLREYIANNFDNREIPTIQKQNFDTAILSSVSFALAGNTAYYQFEPGPELRKVDPLVNGPYIHFAFFFCFGKMEFGKETLPCITLIEAGKD
jgi:hypothetical protein